MISNNIKLRTSLLPGDPAVIKQITESTGFFRSDEIEVAVELASERIEKGPDSGYEFVFAQFGDQVAGYICFGLIPCSLISYDLYWIATDKAFQNRGVGKALLQKCEEVVCSRGGKNIYIETSAKQQYQPTQEFYTRNGYILKYQYEDFYDMGDDKLVYLKRL